MKTHGGRIRWGLAVGMTLVALACSSSDNDGDSGGSPTDPGSITQDEFEYLLGTWAGTWRDTMFNVEGSLQATITVTGNTVEATGVIGLQSLGLGNESGTAAGTIDGDSLTFTFQASTVGNGEGMVSGNSGSGTGTVMGMLNFGDFTFEGTVNEATIDGTFDFTAPSGGKGVATLTKQ